MPDTVDILLPSEKGAPLTRAEGEAQWIKVQDALNGLFDGSKKAGNADKLDGKSIGNGANNVLATDAKGNAGLGNVPSNWVTGYRAVDIAYSALMAGESANDTYVLANAYYDGAWKYKISGKQAARIETVLGNYRVYYADAGTAGAVISWKKLLEITTGGQINFGDGTAYSTGYDKAFSVNPALDLASRKTLFEIIGSTSATGVETGAIKFTNQGSSVAQRGIAGILARTTLSVSLGELVFQTQSGSGLVDRAKIDAAGTYHIVTPGQGLKLPNSSSADVNTLDWYEEGTWTPVVIGTTSAGVGTYSVQDGRYTRFGNRVTFSSRITISAHTGTGEMRITGLPFVPAGAFDPISVGYAHNLTFPGTQVGGYVDSASSQITLLGITSGAAVTAVPLDTSFALMISGTYRV